MRRFVANAFLSQSAKPTLVDLMHRLKKKAFTLADSRHVGNAVLNDPTEAGRSLLKALLMSTKS